MSRFGAVAAGHAETVAAATEILQDGGTAADAALAAFFAACTAEPILANLGGGGFLLARPADGPARLYDFFVHTPRQRRPEGEIDFRPVLADFGTATQEFHIGLGAAATPGIVRGLFAAHRDLCRLPMTRLVAPGITLAKAGSRVSAMQAHLAQVVGPILRASPACRALFAGAADPDGMCREGERFVWPALAETLDALAHEGERLFYEGEIARNIAAACREAGGHLTADDLRLYRAEVRPPLETPFAGARILTNPPPSAGGILIALALALLDGRPLQDAAFDSPRHLQRLATAMATVNRLRRTVSFAAGRSELEAALLAPRLVARWRDAVMAGPAAYRGTTHISVIDKAGGAAALTVTNGESCGMMRPGDGFILNNMLGEEDLNPAGFHGWPRDTRMSSMMAPSLVVRPEGGMTVLGSGGSNRIRSAILQVLVNLLHFGLPLDRAIESPRLHMEGEHLDIEPGYGEEAVAAARAAARESRLWTDRSLFFGGVHAVHRTSRGDLDGHGDPRRGGAAATV
ncbi:MAG: Gamma-glutamyltranspeptidase [Alphaproteobacteria bacterium]|jgi:gamma-glutamyltranspeptidase/glutathione hydrolase|nr:Gamma-glutamyltranspeptidase [Alphaproteobacteria bacterium]